MDVVTVLVLLLLLEFVVLVAFVMDVVAMIVLLLLLSLVVLVAFVVDVVAEPVLTLLLLKLVVLVEFVVDVITLLVLLAFVVVLTLEVVLVRGMGMPSSMVNFGSKVASLPGTTKKRAPVPLTVSLKEKPDIEMVPDPAIACFTSKMAVPASPTVSTRPT
jgi:hypothetical protein